MIISGRPVGIYYDLRIQQISFLYKDNYFNYNRILFKLQIEDNYLQSY